MQILPQKYYDWLYPKSSLNDKKYKSKKDTLQSVFLTTTSSRVSPLVPSKNLTKFPLLFSQMYSECCRDEPATMYSPSPEKQHFFHRDLTAAHVPRTPSNWKQQKQYSSILQWIHESWMINIQSYSLYRHKLKQIVQTDRTDAPLLFVCYVYK